MIYGISAAVGDVVNGSQVNFLFFCLEFLCWLLFEGKLKTFKVFSSKFFAKFKLLLDLLSDFCKACRARAIEGFLALYDEKLVGNGFHGFWLKIKSFSSAIGAVSIEIRSIGILDYFTV